MLHQVFATATQARLLGILFLVLGLFIPSLQAQDLGPLNKGLDSLRAYQVVFQEAWLKDNTNTAAKRLEIKLNGVIRATEGYLAGDLYKADVGQELLAAQKEADRYGSARVRRLQKLLDEVDNLYDPLPARLAASTPVASDEDAIASDLADAGSENATETHVADPTATAQPLGTADNSSLSVGDGRRGAPASSNTTYWLFGLSLLFVLAMGAFILVRERVHFGLMTDRVEHLEGAFESQLQAAEANHTAALEQLREERKSLENNTTAFFKLVEERLGTMEEKLTHNQCIVNNVSPLLEDILAMRQQLETLQEATQELERKQRGQYKLAEVQQAHMNKKVSKPSPQSADHPSEQLPEAKVKLSGPVQLELLAEDTAAPTPHPEMPVILRKALAELQLQTEIPRLRTLCQQAIEQNHDLERLAADQPELIGGLTQLAFVAAQHEGSAPLYGHLLDELKPLGILAEDDMVGRMAFSEHYAENITATAYLAGGDRKAIEEPAFSQMKGQVEEGIDNADWPRNTVLATLRPAIIRQQEGARKVLYRGLYVVKG